MSACEQSTQLSSSIKSDCGEWVLWQGTRRRGAWAKAYPHSRTVAVVTLGGEIDASNAESAGLYLRGYVSVARPVVADLTDVAFLGASGMRQLLTLNDDCAKAGMQWALVTNHMVRRLFRILRVDDELPLTSSLGEALRRFAARHP